MKSILVILMAMPLFVMAQKQESFTFSELKLPYSVQCNMGGFTTDGDTTYLLTIQFNNAKYTSITDVGSIYFMHDEEKQKFIQDLQEMLDKEIAKGADASIKNDISKYMSYTIYKNSYTKSVNVYNKKDQYFFITEKSAVKMIEWLKSVTIPEKH